MPPFSLSLENSPESFDIEIPSPVSPALPRLLALTLFAVAAAVGFS